MNWLAHVFLSEHNIDFQVGNFISDPLKGKAWENASEDIKKGMEVHKIIDSYTDSHTIFKQSKKRLKDKGLLKAVIVDFTYDYLLAKNWDKFCNIKLNEFMSDFYKNAEKRKIDYPSRPKEIVSNMVSRDLLNYQDLNHLKQAFIRLDGRVSERLSKRDSAISYYEIIQDKMPQLEKDFLEFFPDLIQKVKENTDINKLSHWKI